MRKILFTLSLLLIGSVGYSQTIPGVNVKQRKEYMMKTYKIDSRKADAYEQILSSLQKENDQLKSQKVTSAQFKTNQKKLYVAYGKKINQLFTKGKYRTWSYCTQELERYQVLSENKFIPYEKMRDLYKAESEWDKERKQLWQKGGEEYLKHEKNAVLIDELYRKIRQILGTEIGNWYINYRIQAFTALENMDRYSISYKDALAITQMEDTHKKKRNKIWKNGKKNADKEIELMASDDEVERNMATVLPSASKRWKNVNHARLDHELKRKFGLNQAQVTKFKTAYSKYAIEEYKIFNQEKLSDTDKYKQLSALNEGFCKGVNPLFSADNYTKWSGWWKYSFERRMKKKGFK